MLTSILSRLAELTRRLALAQHLAATRMGHIHRVHTHAPSLGMVVSVFGSHLSPHALAASKLLGGVGGVHTACGSAVAAARAILIILRSFVGLCVMGRLVRKVDYRRPIGPVRL